MKYNKHVKAIHMTLLQCQNSLMPEHKDIEIGKILGEDFKGFLRKIVANWKKIQTNT